MIYSIAKILQIVVFKVIYTINKICLRMLGVKVGSNLRSFPITTIENPRGIHIGNNVWISKNVAFYAMNGVRIGNDVTIAKDVSFISGDHGFSGAGKRINEQTMEKTNNPIEIQDDVWVGEKAIILKNVTIGKGSVVGAGTVVTKSVDPYSVVAGNPAKVIKTRRQ